MQNLITDNVLKRFWNSVIKTESCWLWRGCKPTEYGQITINYKTYAAHKLSYQIEKGEVPEGYVVCHKCDIPSCVNPTHLFLGTQKDNMRDMYNKGRNKLPSKKRQEYGSYLYIEKKTGYLFANININIGNGRYKKIRRRIQDASQAKETAEILKEEYYMKCKNRGKSTVS